MNYLFFKALHIIAVVTWFAGLFYMPRLFVYFAEAENKPDFEREVLQSQFKLMQRRLWFGITWPSAIAVFIFGGSLLKNYLPLSDHPWLVVKLALVVLLYAYHFFIHSIYKKQQNHSSSFSPMALRVINEISTLFLVSIVFLVVMKETLSMLWALVGLFIFIVVIMSGIKIYQLIRLSNSK
jgi:putative membrane protein